MPSKGRKRKTAGKRHPLILYRRIMDRIWRSMLLLAIVLWLAWWRLGSGDVPQLVSREGWVLFGALLSSILSALTFLARFMGFVQVRYSYILLVTPLMRLKIAYRRVTDVRPVEMGQTFTPTSLAWSDKRFLAPHFGQTALAISTKGWPLDPRLMRLFLSKFFFNPKETGFLLLVSDWMGLSAELATLRNAWQERQSRSSKQRPSMRGLYGQ